VVSEKVYPVRNPVRYQIANRGKKQGVNPIRKFSYWMNALLALSDSKISNRVKNSSKGVYKVGEEVTTFLIQIKQIDIN
jgi:hypothetical protein